MLAEKIFNHDNGSNYQSINLQEWINETIENRAKVRDARDSNVVRHGVLLQHYKVFGNQGMVGDHTCLKLFQGLYNLYNSSSISSRL